MAVELCLACKFCGLARLSQSYHGPMLLGLCQGLSVIAAFGWQLLRLKAGASGLLSYPFKRTDCLEVRAVSTEAESLRSHAYLVFALETARTYSIFFRVVRQRPTEVPHYCSAAVLPTLPFIPRKHDGLALFSPIGPALGSADSCDLRGRTSKQKKSTYRNLQTETHKHQCHPFSETLLRRLAVCTAVSDRFSPSSTLSNATATFTTAHYV